MIDLSMNHGPKEHMSDDIISSNPNGAYFPIHYYTDFISYLSRRPEKFQVITYDDLEWKRSETYPGNYKNEFIRWSVKNFRDRRIKVLIQHDVDSRPQRTLNMLKIEHDYGVRSCSMIFAVRINRRLLKQQRKIEQTEYPLDLDFLKKLVKEDGFVVGYHTNAIERAAGDEATARKIFYDDFKILSEHFEIKYFSPHGGVPSPNGLNNSSITLPEDLKSLIWVHNRNSPSFKSTYSDGGINNPKYDPASRDLISFVKQMRPNNRYRVLIHPQYFHYQFTPAKTLMGSEWYDKMVNHYSTKPHRSLFEEELHP